MHSSITFADAPVSVSTLTLQFSTLMLLTGFWVALDNPNFFDTTQGILRHCYPSAPLDKLSLITILLFTFRLLMQHMAK